MTKSQDEGKKAGKNKEEPKKDAKEAKETKEAKQEEKSAEEAPKAAEPPVLPGRDNIDNDFKPVLIEAWQTSYQNYVRQMKSVFSNVRMHREQFCVKMSSIQSAFLTFLHRKDRKQEILSEFVKSFNEFSDQFPDLREDDQTKEELHQRTDVLSDELWEIVEERKEQAIEERKKVMESGTIESS